MAEASPTPEQIEAQATERYLSNAEFHARVYAAATLLDTRPWRIAAAIHAADLAALNIRRRHLPSSHAD